MMLLLYHRQDQEPEERMDPDALIREARRLRRRRWIRSVSIFAILAAGAALALGVLPSSSTQNLGRRERVQRSASGMVGAVVTPKTPSAMAVGPGGALFVIDTGRDQILRLLANGKFGVVAGSGKRGFSGDGGGALRARLRLEYDSGIAVARDGAVFFADSGNEHVREVLPDGTIRTVAGGGRTPLKTTPIRARDAVLAAGLGDWTGVAGLAIGPDGNLYLGLPGGVYELDRDGMLRHVFGARWNPDHVLTWDTNPAGKGDFIAAVRIAFDRAGDLFVAAGGAWGLYERASDGKTRFVEVLRADGFYGSLAASPTGDLVAVAGTGIQTVSPSGIAKPLTSHRQRLQAALNQALRPQPGMGLNHFQGGGGIAAAPNGTIYADQDKDVWSGKAGILAISPAGHVKTIWVSK